MKVLRVKRRRAFLAVLVVVLIVACGTLYYGLIIDDDSEYSSDIALVKRNSKKFKTSGAIFRDGVVGNYERTSSRAEEKTYSVKSEDRRKADSSIAEYGINIFLSDQIPLDREVPDKRHPECKYWHYPTSLPKASVVVVFNNEGLSVVQRTAVSVIMKSPPELLEEVLFVDDFSSKVDLKEKLETWVNTHESGKIRLVRTSRREGLIRARTFGARKAQGDVVIFLDAHCEVNTNWLPPLLTPISVNRTVMTVPVIDGINYDTLLYNPVYSKGKNFRGIFEWGMLYKEKELPKSMEAKRKYESEPYKSPTHAGGLFAIDRSFFFELGGYDPGLLIWGGENYELSFKVWQCGGSLEWVPCSRVGHIYRGPRTATRDPVVPVEKRKGGFSTLANYRRVAEVWMDEYKEYFYRREPLAIKYDMGDISLQKDLRDRLKCKSFRWFMENVAPDLMEDFPLPPENLYWGELKNPISGKCLDTMSSSTCGAYACHGSGGNQLFRLNVEGQLSSGERCLDSDGTKVRTVNCDLGSVSGPWKYREDSESLYHSKHKTCLELAQDELYPKLVLCNSHKKEQKWVFHKIRLEE